MAMYNERELLIIEHFAEFQPQRGSRTKYEQYMDLIPKEQKRYKCHNCYKILDFEDLIDGKCPLCNESNALAMMCVLDHNGCKHDLMDRIAYCPVCGEAVCPECADHNVMQISRITGYMQSVDGFNNAKRAELRDRVRVNLNGSNEMVRVNQIT